MSKMIKGKIKLANGSFFANDNISEYLNDYDLKEIESNVQAAIINLLDALIIDTENDHNTKETAKRVAKMYVQEVFKGRYLPPPKITDFPNAKN